MEVIMSVRVNVCGESERDRKYVETLLDYVGGGSVVEVNDHPRVGDYGVCEFVVEVAPDAVDSFRDVASNFGFV
jgi:hypothetical protein